MSSSWWETPTVIDYTHSVKGLTGCTFCVLGLAIFIYGTKLETALSNQQEQAATVFFQADRRGGGGRRRQENQIDSGLDLRILTLTIGLFLSFQCRTLVDTLYVTNIMSISLSSPFMDLLFVILTELLPTFVVARIMRKRQEDYIEDEIDEEELGLQNMPQNVTLQIRDETALSENSRRAGNFRRGQPLLPPAYQSTKRAVSPCIIGKKNTDFAINNLLKMSAEEESPSTHDDSYHQKIFGRFNPNLNIKDCTCSFKKSKSSNQTSEAAFG